MRLLLWLLVVATRERRSVGPALGGRHGDKRKVPSVNAILRAPFTCRNNRRGQRFCFSIHRRGVSRGPAIAIVRNAAEFVAPIGLAARRKNAELSPKKASYNTSVISLSSLLFSSLSSPPVLLAPLQSRPQLTVHTLSSLESAPRHRRHLLANTTAVLNALTCDLVRRIDRPLSCPSAHDRSKRYTLEPTFRRLRSIYILDSTGSRTPPLDTITTLSMR